MTMVLTSLCLVTIALRRINDLPRRDKGTQRPAVLPSVGDVLQVESSKRRIRSPRSCFQDLANRPVPLKGHGGTDTSDTVSPE